MNSVGTSEGKRPLGKSRRRWKDNIKIDVREVELDDVDWIHLAQDRARWRALLSTVMKLRFCMKCWEILELLSDW
jgi:hypothetical protein